MKPTPDSHISVLAMNDKGPAPEAAIGRDLVKHGLIVAPIMLGVSAIFWGADGAWSSAYGLGIVLGNSGLVYRPNFICPHDGGHVVWLHRAIGNYLRGGVFRT